MPKRRLPTHKEVTKLLAPGSARDSALAKAEVLDLEVDFDDKD